MGHLHLFRCEGRSRTGGVSLPKEKTAWSLSSLNTLRRTGEKSLDDVSTHSVACVDTMGPM